MDQHLRSDLIDCIADAIWRELADYIQPREAHKVAVAAFDAMPEEITDRMASPLLEGS